MLPINTLRQIQSLYPAHSAALDAWQRGFVQDQLSSLEKFGDDTRVSEKQSQALEKCLIALQKAAVNEGSEQ